MNTADNTGKKWQRQHGWLAILIFLIIFSFLGLVLINFIKFNPSKQIIHIFLQDFLVKTVLEICITPHFGP